MMISKTGKLLKTHSMILGIHSIFHFEENGERAIKFLEECFDTGNNLPTIIVLDLNMPRLNGTQTLRKLKKMSALKIFLKLLILTSLNNIEKEKNVWP